MTENLTPLAGRPAELCLPSHLRADRLRGDQAAEYLGLVYGIKISKNTLAKWRCKGGKWAGKIGGPYYNSTPQGPLYPKVELDKWAKIYLGKLVRTTSETPK